jgi:hypothetical protein
MRRPRAGIYTSIDQGGSWQGGPVLGHTDFVRVAFQAATLFLRRPGNSLRVLQMAAKLAARRDAGTGRRLALPGERPTTAASGWPAGRVVFYSEDQAQSWKQLSAAFLSTMSMAWTSTRNTSG